MDELRQSDELPADLARALATLDERAARAAHKVQVERVAAVVARRLASEPAAAPAWWRVSASRALRVAAALALLVTGGVVTTTLLRHDEPAAAAPGCAMPSCLRGFSAAQTDSVLQALDEVRAVNEPSRTSSVLVEELNAQELRALLQAMQSSEGETL